MNLTFEKNCGYLVFSCYRILGCFTGSIGSNQPMFGSDRTSQEPGLRSKESASGQNASNKRPEARSRGAKRYNIVTMIVYNLCCLGKIAKSTIYVFWFFKMCTVENLFLLTNLVKKILAILVIPIFFCQISFAQTLVGKKMYFCRFGQELESIFE